MQPYDIIAQHEVLMEFQSIVPGEEKIPFELPSKTKFFWLLIRCNLVSESPNTVYFDVYYFTKEFVPG